MVDTIQGCSGQKTADGRCFRMGGGILWNILKTREPKAFQEIMEKGREFEKQFRQHKTGQGRNRNKGIISPRRAFEIGYWPAEQELKDASPAGEVNPPPVTA